MIKSMNKKINHKKNLIKGGPDFDTKATKLNENGETITYIKKAKITKEDRREDVLGRQKDRANRSKEEQLLLLCQRTGKSMDYILNSKEGKRLSK